MPAAAFGRASPDLAKRLPDLGKFRPTPVDCGPNLAELGPGSDEIAQSWPKFDQICPEMRSETDMWSLKAEGRPMPPGGEIMAKVEE